METPLPARPLFILLMTATVIGVVATMGAASQRWNLQAGAVMTEVGLILAPVLAVAASQGRLREFFSKGALEGRAVPRLVGFGAAMFVAAIAAGAVVQVGSMLLGLKLKASNPLALLLGSGSGVEIAVAAVILVVLAPVCEEALFRGLLQPALARAMSPRAAIVITAVVFGLFHLNPVRFAPTALIGLGAGVAREKYHSVWAAVIVHATCNGLALLLGLALWGRSLGRTP